jgi:hypothetical protein
MRVLTALLAVASLMLPSAHRARWREEAGALLFEVHGRRRWWFALDTVLKAPVLAWCHRVAEPPPPEPPRVVAALTGVGLIATSVLAVTAVVLAPALGEPAAEFLFLTSPCGLLGFVAVRGFRRARHHGGGIGRYTVATLVSVFAGTGPVAAGALSVVAGAPMIAVLGAVVPGAWLATVSVTALTRQSWPRPLCLLGLAAGASLVGVLVGVQVLSHVPVARPAASGMTVLSTMLLIPSYLAWSTWTGIRLLLGRARQLA